MPVVPVHEKSTVLRHTVNLGGGVTVRTMLDTEGQHTFCWLDPIGDGHVPPGKVCLYTYPEVVAIEASDLLDGDGSLAVPRTPLRRGETTGSISEVLRSSLKRSGSDLGDAMRPLKQARRRP